MQQFSHLEKSWEICFPSQTSFLDETLTTQYGDVVRKESSGKYSQERQTHNQRHTIDDDGYDDDENDYGGVMMIITLVVLLLMMIS